MLPKNYRDWKEGAIHALYMQRRNFDETIKPSELHVVLMGKHNRKSDLDNQISAIADVLVDCGFLPNDNMTHITKLSAELRHSTDSPFVLIELI